ncbi:class I glutamine amidotransferase-like protein [Lentinula lateritia]|uniref:Class I glutamine amidotransferase-like protein n=1 Tax=Lentinula aff. lateritia TaxID=2804960 RepID=A0ACC1U8T0_9AGAR|nr:class I glutamine amidotransferase-like protein [Lentinula aff. lateritia]KAJ3854492.1 class I glutamine amidotransferase-like protein [Lentinula lateritia]
MSSPVSVDTSLAVNKTYHLAVCLFPEVTTLDYQGPIELLGGFSTDLRAKPDSHLQYFKQHLPSFAIDVEYLSHSEEPITPSAGPKVLPTGTYEGMMKAGKQFDILLIPGGPTASPVHVHPSLLQFLKQQAPGAKHILTICTGSWILAGTGLLDGKKATTNKMMYKIVTESTKDLNITWIPKARYVVNDDKKIWTSSGVTAGMDLAHAFLEHLAGRDTANSLGIVMEMSYKEEGDDAFAAVHGLA